MTLKRKIARVFKDRTFREISISILSIVLYLTLTAAIIYALGKFLSSHSNQIYLLNDIQNTKTRTKQTMKITQVSLDRFLAC